MRLSDEFEGVLNERLASTIADALGDGGGGTGAGAAAANASGLSGGLAEYRRGDRSVCYTRCGFSGACGWLSHA